VKLIRVYGWSMRRDPVFARSALISFVPAFLAACLEAVANYRLDGGFFDRNGVFLNETVYGVVTTLLGFLIVFRNSQAYLRFWEAASAMYQMHGELFDATSSILSFCSNAEHMKEQVSEFRHTIIRVFSLLSALMSEELMSSSGTPHVFCPTLDLEGLGEEALEVLNQSHSKVECVCQWVQQLTVSALRTGVIDVPAPIATRAFQEIGGGLLRYHEARKIAEVPFPNAYMATMMCLLVVHMMLTPLSMIALVGASGWAFLLTFVSVFTLWSLAMLGVELDNPFKHAGGGLLDMYDMQDQQNKRLLGLAAVTQRQPPRAQKGHKTWHEMEEENYKETRTSCRDSRLSVSATTSGERQEGNGHGTRLFPDVETGPTFRNSMAEVPPSARDSVSKSVPMQPVRSFMDDPNDSAFAEDRRVPVVHYEGTIVEESGDNTGPAVATEAQVQGARLHPQQARSQPQASSRSWPGSGDSKTHAAATGGGAVTSQAHGGMQSFNCFTAPSPTMASQEHEAHHRTVVEDDAEENVLEVPDEKPSSLFC